MQLGNILTTASQPVVGRLISFQVLVSPPGQPQKSAKAEAMFAFVDEDARHESKRLARMYLEGKYKNRPIPDDELVEEEYYWFLMAALRDKEDPTRAFCPNEDYPKFRQALILRPIRRLLMAYDAFVDDEYPELATEEQRTALAGEASGN